MSLMEPSPASVYHADLAAEAFRWALIAAAAIFLLIFLLSALGGGYSSFFGYYWF